MSTARNIRVLALGLALAMPGLGALAEPFTPVYTLEATTYLHSVIQPDRSFGLQWLMPVTGLENNGTPVQLPSDYGLYLTINATGMVGQTTPTPIASQYYSIDVTLWADPGNDAGTASSTVGNGAAFSGNTANDIALATGTMVSGTMSVGPDGVRHATYIESLTPTADGTLVLGGSIGQGDLLTEQFTTQPNEFQVVPPPVTPGDTSGNSVNLVNGGAAAVTLSDPNGRAGTFLLPAAVPEPSSVGIVLAGLFGWFALPRRSARS